MNDVSSFEFEYAKENNIVDYRPTDRQGARPGRANPVVKHALDEDGIER